MRAEMLGFVEPEGDAAAWAQLDAGGAWTQDGEEHLLAWTQMDVRAACADPDRPPRDRPRLLPIGAALLVAEQALEHLGSVDVLEADAIVPLRLMADPVARLAVGRDWLLAGDGGTACDHVVVVVDAGGSANKSLRSGGLVDTMMLIGEGALGAVTVLPSQPRPPEFVHRVFAPNSVALRCEMARWSVAAAAWVIELVARSCRELRTGPDVMISVRRGDAPAPT